MSTCKTCRWWGLEAVYGSDVMDLRLCTCPKFDVAPEEPLWRAGVVQFGNDAGWVKLGTGPEFGCIHHEVK